MNSEFIGWLLFIVTAFGVLAELAFWFLKKSRAHLLGLYRARWATPELPKLTLSPAPEVKVKWHAMPCGTRIELAGTGFYIVLEPQNKMQPYTSYSPEGVEIACASGLAILKALAEIRAEERAEFAPINTWTPLK